MYGCESWTLKKAEGQRIDAFWTVVLEKTNPLNSRVIKPVNPKGNQCWIFIGRTDVEAEAPILCPPVGKSQLFRKDVGKVWGQEEKRETEDQTVGWHHWLNGQEFEPLWEIVKDTEAWCDVIHGVAKSRTWLNNWTITAATLIKNCRMSKHDKIKGVQNDKLF